MIRNKAKQKEHSDKHYAINKQKIIKRSKEYTKKAIIRNKEFISNYLDKNPCVDCNETDQIVLEFDHVKGEKKGNISKMVLNGCSLETLKKEIEKCEVRCANCHRRMTYKRRKEQKNDTL